MRLIYYVPDNMSIDDYKSEWEQVVAEVHHGLSPNIEDYVKDPTKAQVVEIPEYRKAHIPIMQHLKILYNMFMLMNFLIKMKCHNTQWRSGLKNLDNPSETQVKLDTHLLQYDNF